jgi:group I intron endonuclease
MAYIYTITNTLTNKIYVGATARHPRYCFQEHCRDAKRFPSRSLYRDINKYGKQQFRWDILEQCDDTVMHDREVFWIAKLQSFENGYNDTLGGTGKALADCDWIIDLWQQGKTNLEIQEITSYDTSTIKNALKVHNITYEERQLRGNSHKHHAVIQLDAATNTAICTYDSLHDAYAALGKAHSGHIAAVCAGKRSIAYGYKWAYADENI